MNIISARGWRPRSDGFRWHEGYDVVGAGQLRALLPGEVVALKADGNAPRGYGNMVVVRVAPNFSPSNLRYYIAYAHLAALPSLRIGDPVTTDTIIGAPGRTSDGRYPGMGAHVHIAGRWAPVGERSNPFMTQPYANRDFNLERLMHLTGYGHYLGHSPGNARSRMLMDSPWQRPPGHANRGPRATQPEVGAVVRRGPPWSFTTRSGDTVHVRAKKGESQGDAFTRVSTSPRWKGELGDPIDQFEMGSPAWMLEMSNIQRSSGGSSTPDVAIPPLPAPQSANPLSSLPNAVSGLLDALRSLTGTGSAPPPDTRAPGPPAQLPGGAPPPQDIGIPEDTGAPVLDAPASPPATVTVAAPATPDASPATTPPATTPPATPATPAVSAPTTTPPADDDWQQMLRDLLRELGPRSQVLATMAADPNIAIAQGMAETRGNLSAITREAGGASVGVFGLFSRTYNSLIANADQLPESWRSAVVPVGAWNNVALWTASDAPWRPARTQVAVFGLLLIAFSAWVHRGFRIAQQITGTSADTREIAAWATRSGAPQPILGALLRLFCKASSYAGVASLIRRDAWRTPVSRYIAAYNALPSSRRT